MKHNKPIWTLLALLAAANGPSALQAAQLNLAQSPPGAASEPAPNIIVSVDDSGSMGLTGIATLQNALTQTFSQGNVANNRIRLGWQSMNRCRGIPSANAACNNLNGVQRLSGAHRTNFLNWVNGLTPGGPTPSHLMIDNAGQYLMRTDLGVNSPWASNPGTTLLPELSCRKSFHIFMTDGAWNGTSIFVDNNFVDASDSNSNRVFRGNNPDGTNQVLPDGTSYSTASNQTRLYQDAWGSNNLSTLSDLSFFYWATDLQPAIPDNVRPTMNRQSDEDFGAANPAVLTPYWNPRNNPATWQNMTNYTIGFDPDGAGPVLGADQWNGAPVWDSVNNSTFGGDLASLIRGDVVWPTPYCGAGNTGTGNLACDLAIGYNTGAAAPLLNARKMELWHAALNSRGRFVPAPNAQALVNAFNVILAEILTQTSSPLVSIASSASRLRSNGFVYVAGYDSTSWEGKISSYAITAGTNAVSPTPTWQTATTLDAAAFDTATRNVLTFNGTNSINGTTFTWANLSPVDQTALIGTDSVAVGQNRVNYLRGDRNLEVQNGGTMRNRTSRLGDIVNSNIWNTNQPLRMSFEHTGHKAFRATINALNSNAGRVPALYVGANDGMLHAFNANNGQELFAYVPKAMYATLRDYTLTDYGHRFYVDGHPFTGDAVTSGTTWRTVLVSGLGGGGRGYFVLDVTDPTAVDASSVLIDKTAPAATPAATGDVVENDIGHIYAQPVLDYVSGARSEQIVKLNNGRWAVVMGNGINSVNERPVLLIQYLDGTRGIDRIVADGNRNGTNGLSAPRLIDIDGDGTVDLAYAGDLQGNLWKFNLTSKTATNWGVSSWSATAGAPTCKGAFSPATSCVPLMVAKNSGGTRQPITAAPLWLSNPIGGIQLSFGTGRNLTETDSSNTDTQTLYSVLDKSTYETVPPVAPATTTTLRTKNEAGANVTVTNARSKLVEQVVDREVGNTNFFDTSKNDVDYGPTANKLGWFFDLPLSRERALSSPQFFEGQKVIYRTTLPKLGSSGETCNFVSTAEDNWINVLNMLSGKPSTSPTFASTDGSLKDSTRTRAGDGDFITITRDDGGVDLISFKNDDDLNPDNDDELKTDNTSLLPSGKPGARADWREIR